MTVYQPLPRNFSWLAPLSVSIGRDVTVSEYITGRRYSTTLSDYDRQTYSGTLFCDASTDRLEEIRALLRHVETRGEPLWIKEPLSQFHGELLCGVGDGSIDSFALPIYGASSRLVFVDGVYQSSGVNFRDAANLLSDADAAVESVAGLSDQGTSVTLTLAEGISRVGRYSCKVTTATSQQYWGVETTPVAATVGRTYTGHVAIYGKDGSGRCAIYWLDSGSGYLSAATDDVTVYDDEWTDITVTGVAPSSTAYAMVCAQFSTASSSGTFFADAFGLAPGELVDWYQPALAPGVVEFGTAPTAGEIITGSGAGYRLARVRLDSAFQPWVLDGAGHARLAFAATEELDV